MRAGAIVAATCRRRHHVVRGRCRLAVAVIATPGRDAGLDETGTIRGVNCATGKGRHGFPVRSPAWRDRACPCRPLAGAGAAVAPVVTTCPAFAMAVASTARDERIAAATLAGSPSSRSGRAPSAARSADASTPACAADRRSGGSTRPVRRRLVMASLAGRHAPGHPVPESGSRYPVPHTLHTPAVAR